MAKKSTKSLRDVPTPKIVRNYDIFSIEKRVHDLETNGGGGGGTSDISYSADEHEIGTWVDGTTKVYEKTVTGLTVSVSYGSWVDLGAIPATKLLEAHIYANGESGYDYENGLFMDPVMIKSGHLYIRNSGANGTVTGYTIRYLK